MKYILNLLTIICLMLGTAFAQEAAQETTEQEVAQETTDQLGPRGKEEIANEIIYTFENANRWYGEMYIDNGIIRVAKKKGAPKVIRDVEPESSRFVLGAKVNFFKRSFSEALIKPPSEVPISGFVKKISIWAVGVNLPHEVYAIIKDFKGNIFELKFTPDLNYYGWKKLEINIPNNPEETNIVQDYIYNQKFYHRRGITFLGLKIKFYAFDAIGEAYFYFDQLEVENDVYLENIEREQRNLPEDEREIPLNDW